MWVPFPNKAVEVPADPREDCRGQIVVGFTVAILLEAAAICCAVLLYELLESVMR